MYVEDEPSSGISARPCVALFFPSGSPRLSRGLANILRAAGYHALVMENCDQDARRVWWERHVAPLDGPLVVHGPAAREAALRVREVLARYEAGPIWIVPIGSDTDPVSTLRPSPEVVAAPDTVFVFWPRWEPGPREGEDEDFVE